MKKESIFKRVISTEEGHKNFVLLIGSLIACIVVSVISQGGSLMYLALFISFISFSACNNLTRIIHAIQKSDADEDLNM